MKNDCHFVQEEFKIQKEVHGSHSQLADAAERTQILSLTSPPFLHHASQVSVPVTKISEITQLFKRGNTCFVS